MSNEKSVNSYRDLLVWQKSIVLVKQVYRLTQTFPADERFGLIAQMRRAAVSIPSNIAEGQARHTTGVFIQFIAYAEGSLAELDTQVTISVELGYCTEAQVAEISALMTELRKMLNALRRKLANNL
ncbi:MAG: four helix bundle protein [Roseiflexaceae bacterium]|nr:four helix bundle protein [Roseiflexaceae bacterium]